MKIIICIHVCILYLRRKLIGIITTIFSLNLTLKIRTLPVTFVHVVKDIQQLARSPLWDTKQDQHIVYKIHLDYLCQENITVSNWV